MKNFVKVISLLSFLSFYSIDAQQVVKKDTLNGTVLTMTMDGKVNAVLTDLEGKCDFVSTERAFKILNRFFSVFIGLFLSFLHH